MSYIKKRDDTAINKNLQSSKMRHESENIGAAYKANITEQNQLKVQDSKKDGEGKKRTWDECRWINKE